MSEFASTTLTDGPGGYAVSHGNDGQLFAEFYWREVEDEKETRLRGVVVKLPVEYVRIEVPGDKLSKWDMPVKEEHRMRWPQLYDAFKRNEEQPPEGIPLEKWPLINMDMRRELNRWGFRTVNQISEATDSTLSNLDGNIKQLILNVRRHAELFLSQLEKGAQERRLTEELGERDATIASMQRQMDEMAQQMQKMHDYQLTAPVGTEQGPIAATPPPGPAPLPGREAPNPLEALETLPELPPEEPEKPKRGRKAAPKE